MGEGEGTLKSSSSPLSIHIDPSCNSFESHHPSPLVIQQQIQQSLYDDWLPITESRNGNTFYAAFHILNSNIGFQVLMLPLAFATLGWVWGSVTLTIAFVWQLYTIFLLIRLHESVPGIRHSRYLFLAMHAFGRKLGKVAALFPVMYLSGGNCVMLIITGGGTMKFLYKTLCEYDHGQSCNSPSPTGAEWFLIFTCLAILIAQLPNLNSMAYVSLIGALTSITYCILFWALAVRNNRPTSVSYTSFVSKDHSAVAKASDTLYAIGLIAIAFRGHNVLLDIQGTLPSNLKETSEGPMRRGVTISYILIAICLFPLGIVGFWVYGNQINGGLITSFPGLLQRGQVTKFTMGALYVIVIIHCLTSFQIYAMAVFDNLEIRYTVIKNKRCPRLVRTCIRIFFGGLTFFIAVTFPFLPSLAVLLGGVTIVPVTYAYPCFMWVSVKKPSTKGVVWCFNVALGCLGMIMGALLVIAGGRTLAITGLKANFYHP